MRDALAASAATLLLGAWLAWPAAGGVASELDTQRSEPVRALLGWHLRQHYRGWSATRVR